MYHNLFLQFYIDFVLKISYYIVSGFMYFSLVSSHVTFTYVYVMVERRQTL